LSDTKINPSGQTLESFFRSDMLPQLVSFLRISSVFASCLPKLFQIRIVLDANRVQKELRWRLGKRVKDTARSALHEAIDAGVVVVYAPAYLDYEIEKHYEDIALATKTTVGRVAEEWLQFRRHLHFYAPRSTPKSAEILVDVDDFAYLATWQEIDARAVYSLDRHLARIGAAVIASDIDLKLRTYARSATIRVSFATGSSISAIVGIEFLGAMSRILKRLIAAFKELPGAAQCGMVGLVVLALVHDKSRAKLKRAWEASKRLIVDPVMREIFDEALRVFIKAFEAERESYQALLEAIPPATKRPLLSHARSVCLAAGEPLSLEAIEERVRAGGYIPRSKDCRVYLRKVLRANEGFVELEGFWTFQTLPVGGMD